MNLLKRPPDSLLLALKQSNAFIFTLGPKNPVPWERIPEERRGTISIWLDRRYDRSEFAKEFGRAAMKRRVRMLGIEATLATRERAGALGLDFLQWRRVMLEGCVANWREVSGRARSLAGGLQGSEDVRITTPTGTNVRFRLDDRQVEVSDGLTSEEKALKGEVTFLPAGNVEVSFDEESAEGEIVYDLPIKNGRQDVKNLALKVERGRVVEFAADEGTDIFKEYLHSAHNAGRVSYSGFGLNPNLRFGFTQDDKVLGGVSIGLGDNEMKGGRNRANGQEWWGCVSRATVVIGGKEIMRRGRLVV
jgi:leucyl aminopeptidase (aminopeptidase T)